MKVFLALLIFACLVPPAVAQTFTVPNGQPTMKPKWVTVRSIKRITEDSGVKHKPRIEIDVVSGDPFYVGANEWALRVGSLCFRWPTRGSTDMRSLVYAMSIEEWATLKGGEPMYISYGGCPDASNLRLATPFAYLNKKMLGKKPKNIAKIRLPLERPITSVSPSNKSLDQSGGSALLKAKGKRQTAHMDLLQRQRQFNGFRQVWMERPDGVFHGLYTVFWETGDVPCMQGEYKDGVQDGICTYWDRNGVVERQVRFANDEEIDSRTSPPWFSSVKLR